MPNPDIKTPVDTKPVTIEFSKEPPRTITVLPLEIGPNGENDQTTLHRNIDKLRQTDPSNTTIYVESHKEMGFLRPLRYLNFIRPFMAIPAVELVEASRPGDFSLDTIRKYRHLLPTEDFYTLAQILNSTLESDEVPSYFKDFYINHTQLLPLTLALEAFNLAHKVSQLREGPKNRFFMLSPSDYQGMNLFLEELGVGNKETTRQLLEFKRQVFISSLRILAEETSPASDLAVINAIEMGQKARVELCQTLTGVKPSIPFAEDLHLIEKLEDLKQLDLSTEARVGQWVISEEVNTPQQKAVLRDIAMKRYTRLRPAIEMAEHDPASVLRTLESVNQGELKKLLEDRFNFGMEIPLIMRYKIQLKIPLQAMELAYFLATLETGPIFPSKLLTCISALIGVSPIELKGKLQIFTLSPDYKKLEREKQNIEPDLIANLAMKFDLHKTHKAVLLEVAERLEGDEKRVLLELAEGKQPDTVQFREVYQHTVFRQLLLHEIGIELGARVNSILPDTGDSGDLYSIAGYEIGSAKRDPVNTRLKWDRVSDMTVYRAGILMLQGENALGVVNIIRNLTGLTTLESYDINLLVSALDAVVKSSELDITLRTPPILNMRAEYATLEEARKWYKAVEQRLTEWVDKQEHLLAQNKSTLTISTEKISSSQVVIAKIPLLVAELGKLKKTTDGYLSLAEALGYKSLTPEIANYVKTMVELLQPPSDHKVNKGKVEKTNVPTPSKPTESEKSPNVPKRLYGEDNFDWDTLYYANIKELFESNLIKPLLEGLRSEFCFKRFGITVTHMNNIVFDANHPIGAAIAKAIEMTFSKKCIFIGSKSQYNKFSNRANPYPRVRIGMPLENESIIPRSIAQIIDTLRHSHEEITIIPEIGSYLGFILLSRAYAPAMANNIEKRSEMFRKVASKSLSELTSLDKITRKSAELTINDERVISLFTNGQFPGNDEGVRILTNLFNEALVASQLYCGPLLTKNLPAHSLIGIAQPDETFPYYLRAGIIDSMIHKGNLDRDELLQRAVINVRIAARIIRGKYGDYRLNPKIFDDYPLEKLYDVLTEIREKRIHTELTEFSRNTRAILEKVKQLDFMNVSKRYPKIANQLVNYAKLMYSALIDMPSTATESPVVGTIFPRVNPNTREEFANKLRDILVAK